MDLLSAGDGGSRSWHSVLSTSGSPHSAPKQLRRPIAGPPLTERGFRVLECDQPARKDRRGGGKSDAIDAHLAVLVALRKGTTELPTPRTDGPREALRILLASGHEMVTASTGLSEQLANCAPP